MGYEGSRKSVLGMIIFYSLDHKPTSSIEEISPEKGSSE